MAQHRSRGSHQPPTGLAHGGKRLGEDGVQGLAQLFSIGRVRLVEFVLQPLALHRIGAAVLRLPELVNPRAQGPDPVRQQAAKPGGLALERFRVEGRDSGFLRVNLREDRGQSLGLPAVPGPEEFVHNSLDHASSSR